MCHVDGYDSGHGLASSLGCSCSDEPERRLSAIVVQSSTNERHREWTTAVSDNERSGHPQDIRTDAARTSIVLQAGCVQDPVSGCECQTLPAPRAGIPTPKIWPLGSVASVPASRIVAMAESCRLSLSLWRVLKTPGWRVEKSSKIRC